MYLFDLLVLFVCFDFFLFSFALEFFQACSRGTVISLLTIPNNRSTNHTASSTLDL